MRKMQIALTSIILFIVLVLGFGLAMQTFNGTKTKAESATDFTQFTEEEQATLNNQITSDWNKGGSYENISGTVTNNIIQPGTDRHFVLTGDVVFEGDFIYTKANYWTNIVLNGYSISGTFNVYMNAANARFFLYDKVPNVTNAGTYNPNPDKYYMYNSATGGYTTYSTTRPTYGVEVTSMPTFQTGTYIHIRGSAVSPNSLSTTSNPKFDSNNWVNSSNNGLYRMYGINFVGSLANDIFTFNKGIDAALYQCTIIGNKVRTAIWIGYMNQVPNIKIEGCKIYGNQTTLAEWILPSGSEGGKSRDILIERPCANNVTVYKNNIGSLCDYNNSRKAVYLKGVNFNRRFTGFSAASFEKTIATMNNIEGTIELVSYTNLAYNGKSPNLNFILHGGKTPATNSSTEGVKGANTLLIYEDAVVNNITTAFENPGQITIKGKVASIASTGSVEITSSGNTTITENQAVKELVVNGQVMLMGSVEDLIVKGGSTSIVGNVKTLTWESGEIIVANSDFRIATSTNALTIPKEATLTVAENVNLPSSIDYTLQGTLNILGTATLSNVTAGADSVVNVARTGIFILPVGKAVSTLHNAGTTTIEGSVTNVVTDAEVTIAAQATVTNLTVTNGHTQILGTVTTLINDLDAITSITGTVKGLNFLAGTIRVLDANALQSLNITIPSAGNLFIAAGVVFTNQVTNNGTLTLEGVVDNFSGTGVVHIAETATLEVPVGKRIANVSNSGQLIINGQAENVVCIAGSVRIGESATVSTLLNNANAVVLGAVSKITNQTTSTNKAAIATLTIGKDAVVDRLENFATATLNNNIETVVNSGILIQNSSSKIIELQNAGLATIRGKVENAISAIDGDMRIEQAANITTLHVAAGTVTLVSIDAIIDSDIRVEEFAVFNVVEGVILENYVYNYGTLNVAGVVNNIISTGFVNITPTGSVTLQGGLSIDSVTNEGNLDIAVGSTVKTVTNRGTLVVNIGANVNEVLSEAGTTTIADSAIVDTLRITGGHVTVRTGSTTNRAELQAGTLEMFIDATVHKLVRGQGNLIDHNDKLAFILLLVFTIGGGTILVAALVILTICLVKRKNKKSLQGAFDRIQDIAASERIRQRQERMAAARQTKK